MARLPPPEGRLAPMRVRDAALGIASALAVACGGASAEAPNLAVTSFAEALRAGDARATFGRLDEGARRGRSEERHAELVEANAAEMAEVGEDLGRAVDRGEVRTTARVRLRSGEEVLLVLEDGGWRVDGGVLDAVGLATPEDAVAALRRALLRRDLPGLERILSRQTRAEWEAEVRRIVEATADREDLAVEIEGNRARVTTTGGGTIELVRESGEWHVVDLQAP